MIKKVLLLFFVLAFYLGQSQNPNCNSYYAMVGTSLVESSTGIPNTSTVTAITIPGSGIAVGPSFGFPAPNPTYWTTSGGTYWYYNGAIWVNTTHSTGSAAAVNPGGSKNFIYNIVGGAGQVWKYDGTGPATLLATIPALAGGGPYDLVGDDQDNFYYLRTQIPQALQVYNKLGVLTCSYTVTGITPAGSGGGFAIVGNTVTANNGTGYYVGLISGSALNFTATPASYGAPSDFANCYLNTTFNSTITASPSASITCTNSLVTLTATAPASITPLTYTWTGPGIVTSVNNATVNVNQAGVYTCSLTNPSCPNKTSVKSFTVFNTTASLTITVSPSNPTKCSSGPAVNLTASGATNYTWSPSATLSSSVGANVTANPTVTTTYTVLGATGTCTGSTVITVSVIPNPTINITSGTPTICLGSSASLSASGATSYTWNPGGLTGTPVSVSPTTTTVYTVVGASGSCTSSATATVVVVPGPTLTTSASPSTICSGNSSTLTAGGALTYTWLPGGLTGSSVIVSPSSTTTYTVNATTAGGCISSKTISLVVNPTPTISVSPSSPTICAGRTTTLTASGALTYTWAPGPIISSSIVVTPLSSTIYTVTGANASCSSTNTVMVTVVPAPTVSAVSSSTAVCAGSTATLTGSGASTYTWLPGAIIGNTVVVTPTVSTTYTVRGSNGFCVNINTITITANPNPTVTASGSPTNICSGAGTSVTLTASGASTYTWNPSGLTGPTVVVTPTTSITFTVRGANAFGCLNIKTVSISVTATPTLTTVLSTTAICSGSSATLTGSGATSYTWNPGSLSGGTVVVSPTVNTTYTLTGANGICTSTQTINLLVNSNPTITASSSPTSICSGSSSTLTANGASSYTWNPGALTGQTVNVTPGSTTNYTVIGSNAAGCTSTAITNVSVTPTPTLTAVSNPTAICIGSTATLTSTGASSYTWNPGSISGASIAVTPTVTTTYTVSGVNGVCLSTKTVALIVNPLPTVTAVSSSTAVCSGSSATLTGGGALTYTWNPGSLTGTSVVVNPTVSTTYTLTGNNGNCSNTSTISLVVNPNPTITASASSTNICSASATTVTLTATGAVSYLWLPGGLSGPSVTVSPSTSTSYTVIGTSSLACISSNTVTVLVTPTPTLIATSSSSVICSGNSATLTGSGATSYTWNPGAITSGTTIVTPTVSTTYTLTGANGICTSTKTISLVVNATPTITATSSPTNICSGNSSTLTANGASTYTWMPGAVIGQTINVTPGSTTNYTVLGASASGCTNTAITIVSVTPSPTLTAVSIPTAICIGNTATLTSTGASTYTWMPGSVSGGTISVTPTVTTTYTVIGTNGICVTTKTVALIVNPLPTVTAISSPTSMCIGSSATLTGSGATNYTWTPGSITGSPIVVTPTVTTTYTVNGFNGTCSNTATLNLIVNQNPTITVAASATNICSASLTTVTLTSSGAVSYLWLPGGLSGPSVTVSPSSSTTYTVIGTSSAGCISSKTISVLVTPTPTLIATSSSTAICIGTSGTLTASGATTYTWMPGSLTGTSVVVSPTVSTTYMITGANGICVSTQTINLVVNSNPTITANATPTVICEGTASTLSANGGVTYTWSPGAVSGQTMSVTPSVTTVYTVTGSNGAGCTNSNTVSILVNPNPTLVTVSSPTAICIGETSSLTVNGASTYTWNPGTLTGSVVAVNPASSTIYTVQGTGSNGCISTTTVDLNVTPIPTITAISSQTLICTLSPTAVTLSASGATNYTWMPGSLTGSVVVTTPTATTIYTVTGNNGACNTSSTVEVIVTNCNNTVFGLTKAAGVPKFVNGDYEVTYTVTAVNASTLNLTNITMDENLDNTFPLPTTYTVISPPTIISQGSSLSINPSFDGSSNISLTSPLTSTLLPLKRDTIVFTVKVTPNKVFCPFKNTVIGYATVFGTIVVSDSSNNGFNWDPDGDGDPTNNDTLTEVCFPEVTLTIPTGFSPNSDGINDLFVIDGLNGRTVKLTVFNRWGNKVYENPEYDNTWNGTVNISAVTLGNSKLPQATYFYIVEFNDGEKEVVTGYVVLQY